MRASWSRCAASSSRRGCSDARGECRHRAAGRRRMTDGCIIGYNGDSAHRPERGSHDSGAALIDREGRVVAACNEERFSRIKQDVRFPFASLAYVSRECGHPSTAASTWLSPWRQKPMLDRLFRHLHEVSEGDAALRRYYWKQQHGRWARLLRHRRRTLPEWLHPRSLYRTDHHHCHAATAYYCAPFGSRPVLVLTLDGQGDFASGSLWHGADGRLTRLADFDALNSIGNLYAAFTGFLGFTPNRHEGKIVGLAAYGRGRALAERLLSHCRPGAWDRLFDAELTLLVSRPGHPRARRFLERLCEGASREDIAAGIQEAVERLVVEMVRDYCSSTGCRLLALAGGVFANVKLNQRILEMEEVDNIYVHPNMGDGGLAVGAALAALAEEKGGLQPRFLQSVYLGPDIGAEEARSAIEEAGLAWSRPEDLAGEAARLLAEGKVVARAAGRMEYGPRALGNRSILASCDDPSINQWLNARLRRTEFMPFAPIIMEEHARDYFPAWRPEHVAARFMTVTYDASELAKENIPAAIHVDGTARPQVLRREDNPEVYAILAAYHRRTGVPALINTSFNMHEEPIVCTAVDAVRAFMQGELDALICADLLVVNG
ncbi:MAG: carbamoyl transferase [Zetaproteobacteria bacterium]|nr:MAG: carbamoyl transferase [Zetaproteobacteria bacterium]